MNYYICHTEIIYNGANIFRRNGDISIMMMLFSVNRVNREFGLGTTIEMHPVNHHNLEYHSEDNIVIVFRKGSKIGL